MPKAGAAAHGHGDDAVRPQPELQVGEARIHRSQFDGGAPERSLLVPGDGAPAPYDIEDKPALYAAILAAVPADRVETVETIEAARKKK